MVFSLSNNVFTPNQMYQPLGKVKNVYTFYIIKQKLVIKLKCKWYDLSYCFHFYRTYVRFQILCKLNFQTNKEQKQMNFEILNSNSMFDNLSFGKINII